MGALPTGNKSTLQACLATSGPSLSPGFLTKWQKRHRCHKIVVRVGCRYGYEPAVCIIYITLMENFFVITIAAKGSFLSLFTPCVKRPKSHREISEPMALLVENPLLKLRPPPSDVLPLTTCSAWGSGVWLGGDQGRSGRIRWQVSSGSECSCFIYCLCVDGASHSTLHELWERKCSESLSWLTQSVCLFPGMWGHGSMWWEEMPALT